MFLKFGLLLFCISFAQAQTTCQATVPCVPAETGLPDLPVSVIQPTLPQATVDTTYPVPSRITPVHAGADLQAAINAARCGDDLVLDAGARWIGNYIIPATVCSAAAQILVSSSAMASLPGIGARIQQAQAPFTPTIVTATTGPALSFAKNPGPAYWYFAGIGFTIAANIANNYNNILLSSGATAVSQLPSHIVFDRVLVSGNGLNSTRGFYADAVGFGLINSQVWGFVNTGQDTQAVLGCNSPGPFLISNNYLEATGENIMFGGCGNTPIVGNIPSDITVTRNNLNKQPAWFHGPTVGCNTTGNPPCYDVKDNFECKNCQRVLVDSNIMSYAVAQGQGECIIFNINYLPTAPSYAAFDVTITNNICQHTATGFVMNGNTSLHSARILWRNNLLWDLSAVWGGTHGWCYQVDGSTNFTIDHNTCANIANPGNSAFLGDGLPNTNIGFAYTNNIAGGPFSANSVNALGALLALPAASVITSNLFVGDTWPQGSCLTCNPQGAAYPAANLLYSTTSKAVPAGQTLPCNYPGGATTVCRPLNWALAGMLDWPGGIAGTDLQGFALSLTSPYHAAATDGADLGANIAHVLAAVAGVQ